MSTQSEIARDWKTSRNYIHKCVRKRGCPTSSLKAAREWRDAFARGRPPTDAKQLQLQQENDRPSKTTVRRRKRFQKPFDQSRISSDPLEFALKCARRVEERASVLLQEAIEAGQDSKIIPWLSIYLKALEGRLKTEELCRLEIERRQGLILLETASTLAAKGLNVMTARIVALPEKVSGAVNPEQPDQAHAVLRDECTNVILDAKKGWPKEFSEAVRWPNIS